MPPSSRIRLIGWLCMKIGTKRTRTVREKDLTSLDYLKLVHGFQGVTSLGQNHQYMLVCWTIRFCGCRTAAVLERSWNSGEFVDRKTSRSDHIFCVYAFCFLFTIIPSSRPLFPLPVSFRLPQYHHPVQQGQPAMWDRSGRHLASQKGHC